MSYTIAEAKAAGALCDKCPLAAAGKPVPASAAASGKVKLIIVGEGPGAIEEFRGVPFVGPTGKFVDSLLKRFGFDRQNAHVTNAALCRGGTDQDKERAAACCAPRLANELAAIPTEVPVLAFGGFALQVLTGRRGIMKYCGFVWQVAAVDDKRIRLQIRFIEKKRAKYGESIFVERAENALYRMQARQLLAGRRVVPTIHPASILHGADGLTPVLAAHVRRAVRLANGTIPMLESEEAYKETNSPEEAKTLLGAMAKTVAVDVETNGVDVFRCDMLCLSVSDGENTLVLNPWHAALAPVLTEALANRTVITHNGKAFDEIVLQRHGVELPETVDDTLLAIHAAASHLKKGLSFVAALYCDTAPWKADFSEKGAEDKGGIAKKNLWSAGNKDLAKYNAADTRLDVRIWHRTQKDLQSERPVYQHDMQLSAVCQQMQITGFAFDKARQQELSGRLGARCDEILTDIRNLLGDSAFDPDKPNHVRRALFSTLGVYPFKKTKTGLDAADAEVLERFATLDSTAGRLCKLILRHRAAAKTKSTFIDGVNIGDDGRVHPNWRSFGTVTGRLSCKGPNLQNLTRAVIAESTVARIKAGEKFKDIQAAIGDEIYELETRVREQYVAKTGHVLCYFDLSQSEMRQAAHISGDAAFMASCRGDIHTENAKILFPDAADVLTKDPKGLGKKFRDVAKNAGFGILYLAEIKTIYATLVAAGFSKWISMQGIEEAFARMYKTYAVYYKYCDERIALCRKQGYLRTVYIGRKRWLGRRQNEFSSKGYENTIANFNVQSANADVMNLRILELVKCLPPNAAIIAQIHDALIIEAKEGEAHRLTKQAVNDVWGREITVPSNGIKWVQPIDWKEADRWSALG